MHFFESIEGKWFRLVLKDASLFVSVGDGLSVGFSVGQVYQCLEASLCVDGCVSGRLGNL